MILTPSSLEATRRYLDRCPKTKKGPLQLLQELGLSEDDSRTLLRALYHEADQRRRLDRAVPEPGELTPSEREVLEGAAAGESQAETAARLEKSVQTVQSQRKAALGKLGARNITHAVALAYERDILKAA